MRGGERIEGDGISPEAVLLEIHRVAESTRGPVAIGEELNELAIASGSVLGSRGRVCLLFEYGREIASQGGVGIELYEHLVALHRRGAHELVKRQSLARLLAIAAIRVSSQVPVVGRRGVLSDRRLPCRLGATLRRQHQSQRAKPEAPPRGAESSLRRARVGGQPGRSRRIIAIASARRGGSLAAHSSERVREIDEKTLLSGEPPRQPIGRQVSRPTAGPGGATNESASCPEPLSRGGLQSGRGIPSHVANRRPCARRRARKPAA